MSPTNLGVCVGPSLLWSDSVTPADLRAVPLLVETLIAHCEYLCGPRLPHLLGDPRDSGTEESDCKHFQGKLLILMILSLFLLLHKYNILHNCIFFVQRFEEMILL